MTLKKTMIGLLFALSLAAFAAEETRVLRFPTIQGNRIVFSYAGDLYSVDASGGVARRLTSHEGYEMFPRFSPDGKTIAFTGQYDGNTEVFLMDADGGVPKRLTYTATLGRDDIGDRMGPNNLVMGWTPDGQNILFRSRMTSFNDFNGMLYTVNLNGDIPRELPFPRGGFGSYSPDGKKLAYNRIFREFRTWKRYKGGMADEIWIYDFATRELKAITDDGAQDIIPMWHGNKIYWISDRSKRMNLYVHDLDNGQTTQLTSYQDYDIKFPSLGPDAIVYEMGGQIYRFDLASGKAAAVPIRILNDFPVARGGLVSVGDQVTNYEISPDGKRALLGARGDVFTVPAENGPTRNLTQTSGVHERNSRWSNDGKWIAYISDKSGEDEIHIVAGDGSSPERQVTSGNRVYIWGPLLWSPDSTKIAWTDRNLDLNYVDVASGKITRVHHCENGRNMEFSWSPDSRWLAFVPNEPDSLSRVFLYNLESAESFPATSSWFNSGSPTFSDDGKWLFVTSNRDFNPTYSWTEWNHSYSDMTGLYMIALAKDTKSPFEPKTDEVAVREDKPAEKAEAKSDKNAKSKKETKAADKDKPKEEEAVVVKVDREGLLDRILKIPVEPSNYGGLASADKVLYYGRQGSADHGPGIYVYDFEAKKETAIGEFAGFELSADNKKMIVNMRGGKYAIIDAPRGPAKPEGSLDLSQMKVNLDLKAEWRQIFNESWRQLRDFFYAQNLHGVDWAGVKQKYGQLVDNVNHRNDLTYLIGEMIGELNAGHAYVGGGDRPQPKRLPMGLLGARLSRHESGFYHIDHILAGESWDSNLRSPFRELGVNVAEGDFIISVNGHSTKDMTNIFSSLVDTVNKQVVLEVNGKPETEGARKVTIKPIGDESNLYYHEWVENNIRKVSEASNGQVGYLHVPDMGVGGLNQFVKYYYPQLARKALIVDVRGNGGGNVSPMLIDRLRREAAFATMARGTTSPGTSPPEVFIGPMVCLIDEFSASDGDLFPYRFRYAKLGKLIGKRSWGGVVGIAGSLPFMDGGNLTKPEFTFYDIDGKNGFVIEGYGVDPDIYVDNLPADEYEGKDAQLNKAIEHILQELKTNGRELPPVPADPVRN